MTKRTRIAKGSKPTPSADPQRPVSRLEDMDTHFVSLVTAGANRQTRFLVVKAMTCPKCGAVFKPSIETPGACPKCGMVLPMQAEQPDGDEYGEVEAASAKKGRAQKDAAPDASNPTSDPAAVPSGSSEGDMTPCAPAATSDFAAFIKAARDQADALLTEHLVTVALSTAVVPAAPVAKADDTAAPVGATPEAPALAPDVEGNRSAIEKSLAASEAEVRALRAELAQAQSESRRQMAKAATLRATVGSASALSAGEVTRLAKKSEEQGERVLWGSDLSRLAAED